MTSIRSATYTLDQAREAGLFHPNCMHRLEYVSIAEIPDAVRVKVKNKSAWPGAFGKPGEAVKPDLPAKKQTQQHLKQVKKAAEERTAEEADPMSPQSIKDAITTPAEVRKTLEAKNVTLSDRLNLLDQNLIEENLAHLNHLLTRHPRVARMINNYGLQLKSYNPKGSEVAAMNIPYSSPKRELLQSADHYKYYSKVDIDTKDHATFGNWIPCAKEKRTVYTPTHEFVVNLTSARYNKNVNFMEMFNPLAQAVQDLLDSYEP